VGIAMQGFEKPILSERFVWRYRCRPIKKITLKAAKEKKYKPVGIATQRNKKTGRLHIVVICLQIKSVKTINKNINSYKLYNYTINL
jgi:hypothetical protein